MDGDPTPALTGRRRTRPTSIGCPNPQQPEPGRAPLIAAHAAVQTNRATSKFPWRDYGRFADIGTAEGGLAVQVALAHPHLSGIGLDLPPIRPHFEALVAAQGLSDRLVFQEGTFFADQLPSADVLVMGHILHDWGLDKKRLLLAKAYEAL